MPHKKPIQKAMASSRSLSDMILPLGAIINSTAVALGAGLGILLGNRLSEEVKNAVFQSLGLGIFAIGASMAVKTSNPMIMIGSILLGSVIGTLAQLEEKTLRGSESLKKIFHSSNPLFSEGFIAATLFTCAGSMAVIGSIQEGLDGERTIVLTKTMIDFFAALAFGAAFGSGVAVVALPIVVYQGTLTIFAAYLRPFITDLMKAEIEAIGGLLLLGIGFNLLGLLKIKLLNLLPSLVIVIILCRIVSRLTI